MDTTITVIIASIPWSTLIYLWACWLILRFIVLRSFTRKAAFCPHCGRGFWRIRRTSPDKLICSCLVIELHRYRCDICAWEGLRRLKPPPNAEKNVFAPDSPTNIWTPLTPPKPHPDEPDDHKLISGHVEAPKSKTPAAKSIPSSSHARAQKNKPRAPYKKKTASQIKTSRIKHGIYSHQQIQTIR